MRKTIKKLKLIIIIKTLSTKKSLTLEIDPNLRSLNIR